MIRCPECQSWMKDLGSRRPVSTPMRRAHWDDDDVHGCTECGKQYRDEEDKDWIQGEPEEELA